ncbi:hypothetical protein NLJ89_g157 [Agrocybe chaxingu]|uniref:Importin N-terminal domain-containing protein n=1 Tax=Agrocybe chaxingu TaxID=84603 RepID=A0A9W8N2E8_9AGAR|nr:hypothetical protein NLJ89_g157 [Agrocybe chaxingu]
MLDMFGAYDALQDIASQRSLPSAVRQQAIIQFKNAVVGHWRSRKLLSDEHRNRIRQRCLSFVDEEDETIAECNKVVVSKLARTDYPNAWPNLIDDLVKIINENLQKRYVSSIEDPRDTLRLRRSLKLLNGILKEFSSIKLPNGMKAMAQMVGQLRLLLQGYYSQMSLAFSSGNITQENIASQSVYDNILLSHLVYKCLAKIAAWLWNKSGRMSAEELQQNITWVQELFQHSAAQVKSLADLHKSLVFSILQSNAMGHEPTRRSITVLTKHLRVFGKFFRRLQQLNPEQFVLLPVSGDLVLFYWSQIAESTNYPQNLISDSDEALFPVRYLVQGLVLFKESLSQWTPTKRSGVPNKNTLSQDFVENAVRLLVTRFMPLNTADLENWMADPEEWVNLEDKENDQWEYELRACAERVLMQLCNQFPSFVVPLLVTTFEQLAPQPSVDLESVVQKEALYCAIGRCARRLKDHIDLQAWLERTFVPEARDPNPNYPIIKRRIAWLIGKWVLEECIGPNNPQIWEILVHLLHGRGPGTDTVVRLTAAAALRDCVDSLGFEPGTFAPFLATVVPQLIQLIGEADTLESKRKVGITAESDLLFKASLLVTVTKLIEAIKEHSSPLSTLVVPLIRESLTPQVMIHLDGDALGLWLSALRNTTTIEGTPGLGVLLPEAMNLLATNFDLLGTITRIIESYFLLDAVYVLRTHAVDLFRAYLSAFSSKVAEFNAKELVQSLSLLVQLSPSELWGEAMHASGLFPHLLKTLVAGEADTLLLTEHIYLFSRMLLSNKLMFLQLLSASAPILSQPETILYSTLLDQWWAKFDNMSEARHRKLTAMGTAALVSTGRPEVLERLPGEIFNLWLDVFGELKEAQEQAALREDPEVGITSPTSLVRYWELDAPPDSYYRDTDGTPEYTRRNAVYEQDPIRTAPLVAFVGSQIREAESLCGPANFQNYMDATDPTVLKQLQDALAQG